MENNRLSGCSYQIRIRLIKSPCVSRPNIDTIKNPDQDPILGPPPPNRYVNGVHHNVLEYETILYHFNSLKRIFTVVDTDLDLDLTIKIL